jgi:hypothetical protein
MRSTLWLLATTVLLAGWSVLAGEGEGDGSRGPMAGKRLMDMKKKFDKNGDGKLDEAEREAARKEFIAKHPELHKRMLERFDKDG